MNDISLLQCAFSGNLNQDPESESKFTGALGRTMCVCTIALGMTAIISGAMVAATPVGAVVSIAAGIAAMVIAHDCFVILKNADAPLLSKGLTFVESTASSLKKYAMPHPIVDQRFKGTLLPATWKKIFKEMN